MIRKDSCKPLSSQCPLGRTVRAFVPLQTASWPEDRERSRPFALAPGGDGINLHGGWAWRSY